MLNVERGRLSSAQTLTTFERLPAVCLVLIAFSQDSDRWGVDVDLDLVVLGA